MSQTLEAQMCSDALSAGDESLPGDEIVAEVRAVRHQLAAAVDFDIDRLFDQLKALEAEERAKGRVILTPTSLSNTAGAAA